jgi:hypothetical protein
MVEISDEDDAFAIAEMTSPARFCTFTLFLILGKEFSTAPFPLPSVDVAPIIIHLSIKKYFTGLYKPCKIKLNYIKLYSCHI